MSDIAYKVIVNNNGTDDIIFKTIMLKGNNGSSIASIEKTSTSGNVDTYTVYLDDGTVGGTFTVTNSDASSLNNLTDVTISSAQGGQALIYDGTAGKWKNADIAQSIADQTDVALSSLADGDSLVYDSTTSKWKNEALPDELSELGDVAISSAQSGEALIFNAVTGKWQNGDVVENLESLSDVAISSAQDGNVLAYDANTGKWSNINISIAQSLDDLTDVDITTPSDGQALIYDADSGEWKNGSVSTVGSLDDLTDVSISSAVAGESLRYDGSGWVNQPTKIAMTQAQWNAIVDKQAWRNAHKNTDLVITDAPNLNATAQNLSYDGGVTSTWDEVETAKTSIGTLANLTTTTKSSLVGAINELVTDKKDSSFFKSTGVGNFPNLVGDGQVWLIVGQRMTLNATCVLVCNRSGTTMSVKEVVKDSGFSIASNSNGTVAITYNNLTTGCFFGAIRMV